MKTMKQKSLNRIISTSCVLKSIKYPKNMML